MSLFHIKVEYHHLQTKFLMSATSEILTTALENSLNEANLDIKKLLHIGMDGPNVNKSLMKSMNSKVKATGREGLLDIGSCRIHTLHNSYEKGIKAFGSNVVKLMVSVYSWFNRSTVR